ncbi:basic-leucine zipper (bZIP) transcription factor [Pochonia chlamydosporia 170]|uniref:Basic-leucine zipper (BZIP) transcription factor n=1 Tax=Pochonia chlamydosporia 170 TaxID=1380566 RepID=A0A179F1V7_METCM|nr:basic-leucine zipper (bZIP) transcription factor [Pochonia chlamydosporia 170]OAQ59437.1 basic-leucine zipper (bZIP) transcription factor [Pochonia chlamydosporia 170]
MLGLPGGDKSFLNQFGGTQDVFPSKIDNQTAPSSVSQEDIPEEPGKRATRPKTKSSTKTPKQKPSAAKLAAPAPKTRTQPRRNATKANETPLEDQEPEPESEPAPAVPVPTTKKAKNRRQRSLERNRVAASKCRKRKKQWTDGLEQKKSGLESIHHELQAKCMSLLQESSQLKNFLIGHASCQDPNIDIWIRNEASKFVQNLQKKRRLNSLFSVPSLDGNSSASSSASPLTGTALESPGQASLDLDMDDFSGSEESSEDDLAN